MRNQHAIFRRTVTANIPLFRDPNVLSLGIGFKEKDGEKTGRLALIVAVRKKPSVSKAVPAGYHVPRRVPVAREARTGRWRYLATDVVEARPKSFSAAPLDVVGGYIRVEGGVTAGTLGAFLREQQSGDWYMLSCAHVLTDFSRVRKVGTAVLRHGSGEVLGRLSRFSDLRPGIDNESDVALARVTDAGLLAQLPTTGPLVSKLATVNVGDAVIVHGAKSIQNTGKVSKLEVRERVFGWGGIGSEYCYMTGQIEVEGLGEKGDSGGLVTDDKGDAIGLFVADNGAKDLVMPIQTALTWAASPQAMERAPDDTAELQLSFL